MGGLAFVRDHHVHRNDEFINLVKRATDFFSSTPLYPLPPSATFAGTGVYALYYSGNFKPYSKYKGLNGNTYNFPIYVGKAVPKGWRQSRNSDSDESQGRELRSRIVQHARSIESVNNLDLSDFSCRFMIIESTATDMIGTVEAQLIKIYRPLWNVAIDGFGNHDPGKGRYEQAKSDWDVLHEGRSFADKCNGIAKSKVEVLKIVDAEMLRLIV